ncbi:MAG: 4Fe-4S binding protein [Coriobacteriia bacterium]|nr:4Fe-4S binding protein [Coriobacteriia bacterium]
MSKWDISDMGSWKSSQFPLGAVIPDAGNSRDYVTGGWRSMRPYRDPETCTQCLLCWIVCPDSAIRVADEKIADDTFNFDHCKGCGVCANECPVEAITMSPEGCELPGVK